jgi:hypothetical protein
VGLELDVGAFAVEVDRLVEGQASTQRSRKHEKVRGKLPRAAARADGKTA